MYQEPDPLLSISGAFLVSSLPAPWEGGLVAPFHRSVISFILTAGSRSGYSPHATAAVLACRAKWQSCAFVPCWPRSKAFFTPQSHEPGSRPWPHRGGSEEFRNTGAWPPDHRLRISGQRPWPVPARSFPGDGRRSCFEPSDQAISKALPAFTCYISWKVARVQKTSGSGVHLGFIFLSFLCVSWM